MHNARSYVYVTLRYTKVHNITTLTTVYIQGDGRTWAQRTTTEKQPTKYYNDAPSLLLPYMQAGEIHSLEYVCMFRLASSVAARQ
jgi:hypothetical protein